MIMTKKEKVKLEEEIICGIGRYLYSKAEQNPKLLNSLITVAEEFKIENSELRNLLAKQL